MDKPHVLILGGGFAGLEICKSLKDSPVTITLVDRQNHHLFQPLLYQVATAGLAAPEIAHPIRSIFAHQKNVRVIMDEVEAIDVDGKTASLKTNGQLGFDYIAIGLGVKTGYFGNDQWAKHAPGLKTLQDARDIRKKLILKFERAENCDDPKERDRLLTTVVVGGGPTGVELAGAFAEIARNVLKDDFRKIDPTTARVYLVEAAPRLLTMYHEDLSEYTRNKLDSLGVTVLTETMVKDITEGQVDLGDEVIEAENIVWAAGVEAPAFTRDMGIEVDPAGRIIVEGDLSIKDYPYVFAVGDIAHCIDQAGKRVPGLCPAAIQMGSHVAKIISTEVIGIGGASNKKYPIRKQFRYFDKGSMATIGRSCAVATSMGMKFNGIIAWLMWLFIHLMFLVGYRNKAAVLLQWAYSYFHQRGARIVVT